MAHEFLIKDIAFQAGLSTATVDRVLNGRGGVRRQTKLRVEAAIRELREQQSRMGMSGRTYVFDVLMETPERFADAVRTAFEAEASAFPPAVIRLRFHFSEQIREADMVALLKRIRSRGSHGVVLKAADTPAIRDAIAELDRAGIPVVTLVTDIPGSARVAYAGADNHASGETAAYLIGTRLRSGTVLVSLSSNRFRGEEERLQGFCGLLRARWPHLGIVEISEGYGKDTPTGEQVHAALAADPAINAVYSIGGGNRAIVSAFDGMKREIGCYVAHDLDQDNVTLLRQERLSYVLHHNLASDAASVYRTFLRIRHALPYLEGPKLSSIEIITPFNFSSRA